MTRQANGLLLYLKRALDAKPGARADLRKLHLKMTGRELDARNLWRHTARKVEPSLGTALVYLTYLSATRAIEPSDKPGELFLYKNPTWLKP